ncbi:MAG: hypothetical protein ABF379_06025 [Akkermansiaceae bacterium]
MKIFFERAWRTLNWVFLWVIASLGNSCSEAGSRVTDSGNVITTSGNIPSLIRAKNERKRGVLPESEWNKHKMWKKIGSQPPTYIPFAYPKSSSRSDEEGQWFVDIRKESDGKRIFVPNYTKGPISSTILGIEAKAAVNWQYSKGEKWYWNVDYRE